MAFRLYPKGTTRKEDAKAILSVRYSGDVVVYLLEMRNGADNRLSPDMIGNSIIPALDDVEREWRLARVEGASNKPGESLVDSSRRNFPATLITHGPSERHRFYSNGLDFEVAVVTPAFFCDYYNAMLKRLLFFPLPCVAAINGHAFAGGMALAMSHDLRVMKAVKGDGKGRAMMCMNELDFGSFLPPGITELLRLKIPSPEALRDTVLMARRWSGKESHEYRLVDEIAETGPEVIEKAIEMGAKAALKSKMTGLYAMKYVLYKHLIPYLTSEEDRAVQSDYNKIEHKLHLRRLGVKL